jgi:hypothetical protein
MKTIITNLVSALTEKRRAFRKRRAFAFDQKVVTHIENDGDHIFAQFMRENGEIVIGIYDRVGWHKAPKIERPSAPETQPIVYGAKATDKRNIVTAIENDGEDIQAQIVREDGEVVIGIYKLGGWARAPKAFDKDIMERIQHPPLTIVYTQRR